MNTVTRLLSACAVAFISLGGMLHAQEVSKKFAHITMPDEVKYLTWNDNAPYVGNFYNIWKIDTSTWTPDSMARLKSNNLFKTIQGMAGRGSDLFFYVNGDGIYRLPPSKMEKPRLIRPRSDDFVKNYEEAYSNMGIDPSGGYLLLYGQNENVAVFDIARDMKPIVVFNDHVPDAYWLGDKLWACCLDKVVIDSRTGRITNNNDFIGSDDQTGLTKFYVGKKSIIPEKGETVHVIPDGGEIIRLLYNKGNGDLLLCVSSNSGTNIYKMTGEAALPVAHINGYYGDFAAFGNRIVARTGGGFVEFAYGDDLSDAKPKPIVTDLLKPKMWKGHKPSPYEIYGSTVMDFDKEGNLWIAYNRDLFVMFK